MGIASRADVLDMTHTHTPEFVQSLIVLSNARKELLAAAIQNARKSLEITTAQIPWEPSPYVETPAEQRARARAQRLTGLSVASDRYLGSAFAPALPFASVSGRP
jgi:hypothetical protein